MSAATEQTPEAKRTRALARAAEAATDLAWFLKAGVARDTGKPLKQKDRAALKKHARETLTLIDKLLEDVTT
jgi:acyl-CoA reductase-like NAD-dependent aldehyde dehydrogenase